MKMRKGSVKDLYFFEDKIQFEFSDRYSIFDWGEMPDQIPGKGKSLLNIAKHFDRVLNDNGFKTATLAFEDQRMSQRIFPSFPPIQSDNVFSYKKLKAENTSFLVPLEVIFRFALPEGSSLLKRKPEIKKQCIDGIYLPQPYIEFSTKLEPSDRYIDELEAKSISSLSDEVFKDLKEKTLGAAFLLKNHLQEKNLELYDGKFEFAWDHESQELLFIDSVGIDELRINSKGLKLSKEFLRAFYRNTKWFKDLCLEKEFSAKWKEKMQGDENCPQKLSPELIDAGIKLYQLANESIIDNLNESLLNELLYFQKSRKVFVLGDGGREHAIIKSLNKSPLTSHIYLNTKKQIAYPEHKLKKVFFSSKEDCLDFLRKENIELVVIGPEAFLEKGYSDYFRKNGFAVFGPSQKACRIESSKDFSKKIMLEANIPTAKAKDFESAEDAIHFIQNSSQDAMVIKADGLAAGKGVFVCDNKQQATDAVRLLMVEKSIPGGEKILIEERMFGPEFSAFALFDKESFKFLGTACDYKRIFDGDKGPNTGGMGTYSPSDWLSSEDIEFTKNQIFSPLLDYFKNNNLDYVGVVFAGLMKTETGIRVIEFNARFGDPETQSLLPRIENDFFYLLDQCANSKLDQIKEIHETEKSCLHLVYASGGYPGIDGQSMSLGNEVSISEKIKIEDCYYAGLDEKNGKLVNTGGRVLGLSQLATNRSEAREKVYKLAPGIEFKDMQIRSDIGE
ncbi:MAG: phosphoribosylamine--glycine ligase [Bdellovibrionota bacterium]|nr:phosphoribosylamine--glycine ligase [Bdellovibrionota bacterium]